MKTLALLLLLSTAAFSQMTVGKTEPKKDTLPAVSDSTKLTLRDIQVQSLALQKTLTDAREQMKQLEQTVNEQQGQLAQSWQQAVQKALTDAKLDPEKYDVQIGKDAKDIVFAAKEPPKEAKK